MATLVEPTMPGTMPAFLHAMRSRVLVFLCVTVGASAFGTVTVVRDVERFGRASSAYREQNYERAAAELHILSATKVSSGALHNLGNTEFKLGHLGLAVLAWERAHTLDPWNRNTVANLRFARGQSALPLPTLSWNEIYSSWLPANVWLWTASICLWGGLACLALPTLLARRRTAWTQAGAVVALSAFILTLPALSGLASRAQLGVVTAAEAPLRLTPTHEGEVLGKLPSGDVARIELRRGPYVYVRGEGDRAGWVHLDEFARIWSR